MTEGPTTYTPGPRHTGWITQIILQQLMKRGHGFADWQFSFQTQPVAVCFGPPCKDASVRQSSAAMQTASLAHQGVACLLPGSDFTFLGHPPQSSTHTPSLPNTPSPSYLQACCLGPHTSSKPGFPIDKKKSHNLQIHQENSCLSSAANCSLWYLTGWG